MTIQRPSPSTPEMPDKPGKPGPEVEVPRRINPPAGLDIEQRPDKPFPKPEIDVPGPNLPTPDNPEGREIGRRRS